MLTTSPTKKRLGAGGVVADVKNVGVFLQGTLSGDKILKPIPLTQMTYFDSNESRCLELEEVDTPFGFIWSHRRTSHKDTKVTYFILYTQAIYT